jgi:hypothetical protein
MYSNANDTGLVKFICNEFPLPAGISVVKSPFVLPVKVEVAVVDLKLDLVKGVGIIIFINDATT